MFFLNKLIDNSRRKFPDVHILSYDGCKILKVSSKVSTDSRHVLTCSANFLCSASWSAESYKNHSWLIVPIVPPVSSSENTVKFGNAFFGLANFTLVLLGLFFGFLKTLFLFGFHECECRGIVKNSAVTSKNRCKTNSFSLSSQIKFAEQVPMLLL